MQLQVKESTKDKLFHIVIKASNLQERITLYNNASYQQDSVNVNGSKKRWEKWTQVVAKGNKEKFNRRLKWAGFDREKLTPILADYFPLITELPTWAITLEKTIEAAENFSKSEQKTGCNKYFISDKPIPFEDFYLPFLKVAEEKILASHQNQWKKLNSRAQVDLLRGLLSRLARIGAATLMREFHQFRIAENSLKDLLSLQLSLNLGRHKYDFWLNKLLSKDLWKFFSKYSVLGRLLATATDFWVAATADFLTHLTTDWQAIEDNFSPDEPLQQIVACQSNLSDSHNSGRSVIIVTFNPGLKVVYKPRDLGLETAFYQIIDWCNGQPELLSLPSLKILNYQTHGWSEYVEALPCEDELEIKRFFQRSGMLLCLVHVLEGQDFHGENLIAKGEYPVLVDLEALLHSQINSQPIPKKDALSIAHKEITESVFQTYLLPQWGLNANDTLKVDLGGLSNMEEDDSVKTLTLKHINTDSMQLDYETLKLEYVNSPVLNEVKISSTNYIAEILQGFEQMYDCLLKDKTELLSNSNLLKLIENQKVRFLFRNTNTYTTILQQSYHPDVLEYGIDRSIALDVLSRGFLLTEEKPTYWSMLNAEIESMEQLDIPLFLTNSSSTDLQLSEEKVIPQILAETSFNQVLNHLQKLSETDKQQQLYFIKSAFTARFLQQPQWSDNTGNNYVKKSEDRLDNDLLIEQAIAIAEEIENQAIKGENNSLAWLGLVYNPVTHGFRFQPLDQLGLADGNLGIALFIATLAKITKDERWHNLALQIIKTIENTLGEMNSEEQARFFRRTGIGGFNGLAASAYSLIKIAQLLSEPSLIPIVQKLLSFITINEIKNCPKPNLIGGCAGTLLSLLGCLSLKSNRTSECLEKAIACGDYLLQYQVPPETAIETRSLGFWSGIAGVAYALLRLYEVTQDERYLNTAKDAISLESKAINSHDSDLNSLKIEIALGRLGGITILDNSQIRTEINTAIQIIQQHKIWGVDNLFWGNCGRLEMLLVASEQLKRPELKTLANQWGNKIAAKIASNQLELFSNFPSEISHPGFLHGTAGIGYQLLRVAHPHLLPSILLLQ